MLTRFLRSTKPTIPPEQRVYAVGDVHGRIDLLEQLLVLLEHDNAKRGQAQTILVFLGDLIDRGPDSRGVVTRVRAGVDWARTIALMGNHEAVMLDILDGQSELLEQWLGFGGLATLDSWGISRNFAKQRTRAEILAALRNAVSPDERAWLGRMRISLRIGDYYFVHAGVRPDVALDRQVDDDRLWIRDDFLHSRKKHGAMIVHGHSISQNVEQRSNRIGLDTGAYITGKLTAIGLQKRDRWFLSTSAENSPDSTTEATNPA
jgi:serine/threonine protein phosphatase 1